MTTTPLRAVVAGGVAVLHIALLALLLSGGIRAAPTRVAAAIATRAVPLPARPADPLPDLPPIAADVAMPVIVTDTTPDDDCPLLQTIATALAHDPAVGAAMSGEPGASALMLWDGRWTTDPAPAAAPIRRVVIDRIRNATPACRDATLTGPRLVMVPNGASNLAVAIGSGTWRWSQLLS